MASRTRKIAGNSPLYVDPGFLQFAQWAFSEVGLPDLQVLAWGDFSYEGRWLSHNALLCRDDSILERAGFNFRTPLDADMCWDLIDDNMDLLAACPSDDLFPRSGFVLACY